ncbi:MAG: NTP transferase domain-containing protein [Desulfovibrio sp.]|jgi:CTP:molybdopterin cytidylyltransferase MocA|nr:NTP transferase domain-containing protein [Desulfovibrio sp.]
MSAPHFSALILAAGESSRMGRVKAMLPLGRDGTPALEGIVRLYRSCGIHDIRVVTGFHRDAVEAAARALSIGVVRNPCPEEGMFSSVLFGLAVAAADSPVFVHPVDIPLVRALTVRALVDHARDSPDAALVPTFGGEEGHPLLLFPSQREPVLAYDGPDGLQGALKSLPVKHVPVADAFVLEDMDTPGDYDRLLALSVVRDRLTPEEARRLLELRVNHPRGRAHGAAVGAVAKAFAQALAARGGSVDPELAHAAGLLHDIRKGAEHHETAGAALLQEMGLTAIAPLVADHRDLSLPDDAPITERELVYLADKYCRGGAFVPLSERFGCKMARYREDPKACRAIRGRLERAVRFAERLGRELGREPEGVAREAAETLDAASGAGQGGETGSAPEDRR